jgi:hypothetical protein
MKVEYRNTGSPSTTDPETKTNPNWIVAYTRNSTILALVAFFFTVAVMLAYRPWNQIEVGDPAVYDYIAQSILRGQLPYRDVVDIKGPGGPYLSAATMVLGKAVGLRDVIAVRLMLVVLTGLLSAITCLVAQAYLRNHLVSVIAPLVPLMSGTLALMFISGTQPKLPMILFGMATLLLIARDRPFWAGVCSMLSCLCWQPGLLFTGTAVLIFSRYLTSWRDRRALSVLIGASLPLLVVLVYFQMKGGLDDLWAWTITYNYGVFGPEAKTGVADALQKLWATIVRVFGAETVGLPDSVIGRFKARLEPVAGLATLAMVLASVIGFLWFGLDRVWARFSKQRPFQSPGLFLDALFIPPAVYLGFCLINLQAGPDLIPFVPFVGIFAALFVVKADGLLTSHRWVKRMPLGPARQMLASGLALVVILGTILARTATYRVGDWTLQGQDQEFKTVAALLAPEDKVYVHGTVELLVLLNRPNLNPYVLLDWDADTFAGARRPGGWPAVMDEMESQAPRVVAISRLRTVTFRSDMERWVNEHYDHVALTRYERVFVRKER